MQTVCPSCGQKLASDPPRPDFCPHCRKQASDSKTWKFGDYEILGKIAQGGMGVVYCAHQVSANRQVALKMIRSGQLASPEERERFRTEAKAAAHLDHPNIVPIYEVGEHDGEPYLSMKYLKGGDLAELIEDWGAADHLTQGDRAALIAKLARAVQHAHSRGILHRDIKPRNILIDHNGEPHLADFGIARIAERGRSFTQSDAVAGTPSYMAPEQASGPTKNLTTAADIYSLGAIFYHLLVGRAPFVGSTKQVLEQLANAEPEAIRDRNPLIDRDLEIICLKCLAKNPRERYRSAEDLAEDIERWFRSHPIHARPITVAERARKWSRRNPLAAALSAGAALVILAGLAGLLFTWQRAESAADENRSRLVRFNVANGLRSWSERDSFTAALWFIEGLRLDRGKDEAGHRLRLASILNSSPALLQMFFPGGPVHSAAFSPDANLILTASSSNSLQLLRVSDGAPMATMRHEGGDKPNALFSPDGRAILSLNGNTARLWSLSGEPEATFEHRNITHAVFSADSKTIATADPSGTVIFWNAHGHRINDLRLPSVISALAFSPENNRLLVATRNGAVAICDPHSGEPIASWKTREDLRHAAFSSGAKLVALSTGQNITQIRDAATGAEISELASYNKAILSSAFSPDGNQIVTHSSDGAARIFDARSGRVTAPIFWHASSVNSSAFDASGETLLLASSDGAVRLWSLKNTNHSDPPFGTNARIVASLRSGELVGVQNTDGSLQLWDAQNREPLSPQITNNTAITFGWITTDQRQLLSPRPLAAGKLQLNRWDFTSAQELPPITFPAQPPEALLPSPNGKRCLIFNGRRVELFEIAGGRSLFKSGQTARFAAFSSNSRYLLFGNSESAEVLDTGTGEILFAPVIGNGSFSGGEFSPDGSKFLLRGHVTQLFETRTGQRIGPALQVLDAHFSPNGQSIATASEDGTARIWNASSMRPLTPPIRHNAAVRAIAFSFDGRWLATASDDKTVRVWDAITGEPVTQPLPEGSPIEQLVFAGSNFLITQTSASQKIWPLWIEKRPFKQLAALTQAMASQQIDASGVVTPLDIASLHAAWAAAQPKK